MVLSAKELAETLENAPVWWGTGNKEIYDNAIFVIPPTKVDEVLKTVGEAKPEYEKIHTYGNMIFWSASLQHFNKTRWSKIASSSINNQVTVRNANTTRKLLALAEKTAQNK